MASKVRFEWTFVTLMLAYYFAFGYDRAQVLLLGKTSTARIKYKRAVGRHTGQLRPGGDRSLQTHRPMRRRVGRAHARGQLGIFMALVFGAVALVVVSIVLLFGMDIAGEFAAGINVDNEYSDEANSTVNSTGDAFSLFGTSVLVIPAVAVLVVLLGGLIGAVMLVGTTGMGGGIPGAGGGR